MLQFTSRQGKQIKKRIAICGLIFLIFPMNVSSQTLGSKFNPVITGNYGSGYFTFTDTKDNSTSSGYGNNYNSTNSANGQSGDDIWYKFTIQGQADVTVSLCNSVLSDTYVHLLNSDYSLNVENDDFGPLCSGTKSSLSVTLPAGTYYVVSEGYGTSAGSITTALTFNVQAVTPPPVVDDHNFIKTWDATAPETNPNNLITRPLADVKHSTEYFDGLGRPEQTVVEKGSLSSAGNTDLVSPVVYDNYGREVQKYLPYASPTNDGVYKDNALTEQNTFYTGANSPVNGQGESYFYGKADYEPSPLNRVTKTYAPGINWAGAGKGVSTQYLVNTAIDAVRIWTVTNSGTIGTFGTYASPGSYAAGLLYKNIMVDENGKQVIEFKDKDGKVILKKVQLTAAADNGTGSGHTGWLCTYYIYDDLDNLRCVVQPRGVELISSAWALTDPTILAEQCFRYEYDSRNRLIMKKVPGAGEVYMVYDNIDRLKMTQDANLRSQGKWLVTLYDILNRPVQTGLLLNTWNGKTFSGHLSAAAGSAAYPFTDATTPSSTYWEKLSVTHYDDYTGVPAPLTGSLNSSYINSTNFITSGYNTSPYYAQQIIQSSQTKGMVTWSQVKVLGTTSQFISTVNFYDDKGRLIQVQTVNQSGGTDVATTQYDFSGKVLRTHLFHQKSSTPAQSYQVASKNTYDDLGRLTQIEKNFNNTGYVVISTIEYDALGQVSKKTIGSKKDPSTNTYLSPRQPIETLTYDYNIRGWLLGANRNYAKTSSSTTNYFGFDLGYDKNTIAPSGGSSIGTYTTPAYNGNIGGMVWKSAGDGEIRKYDFNYDAANRLMKADFNQYTTGTFNKTANVDFSVKMGDGSTPTSAYDANGNIIGMTQYGLKLNTSPIIDQLTYTYQTNTNKLSKVTDGIVTTDNGSLADFKDGSNGLTDDYSYDANGNLTLDNNKKISSIAYNYLNLPSVVTVTGKGTITYTYDASGNKLQKLTQENNATVAYNGANYTSNITTSTNYISGFVYESKAYSNASLSSLQYSDVLQFTGQEEGRIRRKTDGTFAYDYFLKDHLGNVRMVLTDQADPASIYQATMEDANRTFENQLFNNIPQTVTSNNKPSGFDADANNKNVSQLFSSSTGDKRIGPGIVLKVMAGDKFKAFVYGWYQPGANIATYSGASSIVTALINAMSGGLVSSGSKGTLTELSSPTGVLNSPLSSYVSDPNRPSNTTVPKAYLNWMVLDEEQFKLVQGSYGAVQIPAITGTMQKQLMQANNGSDITITKNGYLYVYVSNESQGSVYFDDLRIEHTKGPMLEESHYYPFGLTMAGISSKALGGIENKYHYNGKELQHHEFSDNSGLELYDYGARMLDPQIGRWNVIDALSEKYLNFSPFTFGINNPLRYYDPNGMEINEIAGGVEYTGEDAKSAFLLLTHRTSNVYIKIDANEKERKEINAEDKKASNGDWAVFAVSNLSKAVLALSGFDDKSIENLVIANHGASAQGQSWFSIYDKPVISNEEDAINTNEILKYIQKNGQNLTTGESRVDLFKSLGNKVANGGNMALVFCFTGKGKSGNNTIKGLSSLMGNRFNIYLPIGFSAASFYNYTTGRAIATSGSLNGANNPGWITTSDGNTINTIYDIVLSATGEKSFNVVSKKPN
jgi:RHS repeat-associated protein